MSVQPDPEDLNINSAKLAQQNERVLSAREKAKQEADEDEALENFANAFKGKPIPDDWEPNSHPYFMSDLEREMQAGNPFVLPRALRLEFQRGPNPVLQHTVLPHVT
eukprot:1142377-Rhodomonas_salina.3